MTRFLWTALVLLTAVPAHAQTCAGVVRLTFVDPTTSARPLPLIAIRDVDVQALFLTGPVAAGTTPVSDSVSADGSRTVHLPSYADAYVPGTVLALAPRCGTSLLHLVLEHQDTTMTLDLYNVPNHIGLRLDAPVPFRHGRYVFDFDTARRVERGVYSAADVRPAGR